MKPSTCAVIIAVILLFLVIVTKIEKDLTDIKLSSFRLGCISTGMKTQECKALAVEWAKSN